MENPGQQIEVGSKVTIDEIPARGGHVFIMPDTMIPDVSFRKVGDEAMAPQNGLLPTFDTVVHASGTVDFSPGQPFLMPAGATVKVTDIIEV